MAPSDVEPVERPVLAEAARPLAPVLAMLAVMWAVEIADIPLDGRLDRFGIRPRRLDGLDGIVFSPFLHDGIGHLLANSVPLLFLGGAIALGSTRRFLLSTLIIGLVAGVGTWLTGGSGTLVVGASGLVFGYVSYLVSRGVFARKITWLLGGLVVLAVYGSVLWGLLPRPGVSWQGHLFGALGGIAAARLMHPPSPRPDTGEPATL